LASENLVDKKYNALKKQPTDFKKIFYVNLITIMQNWKNFWWKLQRKNILETVICYVWAETLS